MTVTDVSVSSWLLEAHHLAPGENNGIVAKPLSVCRSLSDSWIMLLSLSCSFTALSTWPKHPAVSPFAISIHCVCGWGGGGHLHQVNQGSWGGHLKCSCSHSSCRSRTPFLLPSSLSAPLSFCVSEWRSDPGYTSVYHHHMIWPCSWPAVNTALTLLAFWCQRHVFTGFCKKCRPRFQDHCKALMRMTSALFSIQDTLMWL